MTAQNTDRTASDTAPTGGPATGAAPGPVPPPRRTGAPVWYELTTHDLDGAIAFYTGLFGWQFEDQGPDLGHHRMIHHDGVPVAGATTSLVGPDGPAEEPVAPTAWTVYLQAEDLAATLERARAAGAEVLTDRMPVGGLGAMALLLDPGRGAVGLWEPAEFAGTGDSGRPGTPVWCEELSTDYDAALPFYRDVLGWDVHEMPAEQAAAMGEGFRYAMHGPEETAVAGLCDARGWFPEGSGSVWQVYWGVPDLDAALERVRELGGTVADGPEDSPYGRLATVADPQGARFVVIGVDG